MRTTVNIDDELFQAAKQYAKSENISLGQAISHFLRKGMRPSPNTAYETSINGLPVFKVSENCSPLTLEDVKRGLEDET